MELEEVYALYVGDIYRYIYSLCRHPQTTEDLLQETFYKAYISSLSKSVEDIKPWLFKVAYYTYIDHCRKEARISPVKEVDEAVYDTPESIWLEQDGYNQLLNLVNLLAPLEKQAILLCDIQDCTQQQAAMILDLKINTLKSHLLRGRKKMRELIKKEEKKDGRL